jgi:hypothetical protein
MISSAIDVSPPALMGLLGITDRNIVRKAIEHHRISWTVDSEGTRRIRRFVFGWAKAAVGHDSVQSSSSFDVLLYARASNADDPQMLVELGRITAQLSASLSWGWSGNHERARKQALLDDWRNVELRRANERLVRERAEAEANVRRLRVEVGKANATNATLRD